MGGEVRIGVEAETRETNSTERSEGRSKQHIKSPVVQEAILSYVTTLEMGRGQLQETINTWTQANVSIMSIHVEVIN